MKAPAPPQSGLGLALQSAIAPETSSSGGGLLDAIRKGVQLKNAAAVEKPKEIVIENTGGFNTNLIANVLNQRRAALEDSEDDDDDEEWDD